MLWEALGGDWSVTGTQSLVWGGSVGASLRAGKKQSMIAINISGSPAATAGPQHRVISRESSGQRLLRALQGPGLASLKALIGVLVAAITDPFLATGITCRAWASFRPMSSPEVEGFKMLLNNILPVGVVWVCLLPRALPPCWVHPWTCSSFALSQVRCSQLADGQDAAGIHSG